MSSDERSALLRVAAERARGRRFFVAADLDEYQSMRELSAHGLSQELGCDVSSLSLLALCRRPDPQGPEFRNEVEQIADYVGANPVRLAQLLRAVEARRALRDDEASTPDRSVLMAARDRPVDGDDAGASTGSEREERGESQR